MLLPAFWLLFIFLYYQYGFRALHWDSDQGILNYYLCAHRPRYLAMLLSPLCLLLGFWLPQSRL